MFQAMKSYVQKIELEKICFYLSGSIWVSTIYIAVYE